mmetsp:Transcript_15168/g.40557  ORF Transcript_15168/g.40557 Transcript_15168/m.40557 type:complete len:107 (+) Transcript_15168:800-1120(+)
MAKTVRTINNNIAEKQNADRLLPIAVTIRWRGSKHEKTRTDRTTRVILMRRRMRMYFAIFSGPLLRLSVMIENTKTKRSRISHGDLQNGSLKRHVKPNAALHKSYA